MMKKIALFTAILLIAGMLGGGRADAIARENSALPELVNGNNAFAFDLHSRLCRENNSRNIFFSPYSISAALGMTYAGARGNTEKQMAQVLHFANAPHAAFSDLEKSLQSSAAGKLRLTIANALWGQKNYSFQPEFLSQIKQYYGGGFNTLDFIGNPQESRLTINRWIEKKTEDKIKNLLHEEDISDLTRLVLTNAIYFKGDWASKFRSENTKPAPFYLGSGETATVPMMYQKSRFGYLEKDGLQVLEIPYAAGDLSMVLLLPPEDQPNFSGVLTAEQLQTCLDGLQEREVRVFLPKYKFEARAGLKNTLTAMGMPDAFDMDKADFSGMTGAPSLFIANVIHQAVIEVNEAGSEAAAATAVIMALKSSLEQAPVFRADRPFTFLIRHKTSGAILFMGQVVNPAQQ